MIGDWVYSSFSDIPCKVQLLELRESGCGSVKTTNVEGLKDIASLSPILLTPEILEKNGFEKIIKNSLPEYHIKWPLNHDYDFVVWTGVDGYWNPVGFGITAGGVQADVDYVHQLQHALKLCGIEKQIEL